MNIRQQPFIVDLSLNRIILFAASMHRDCISTKSGVLPGSVSRYVGELVAGVTADGGRGGGATVDALIRMFRYQALRRLLAPEGAAFWAVRKRGNTAQRVMVLVKHGMNDLEITIMEAHEFIHLNDARAIVVIHAIGDGETFIARHRRPRP